MYSHLTENLLWISILYPLLLIPLLPIKKIRFILLPLAAWSALPALLAVLLIVPGTVHYDLPWLILGLSFGLDETGALFLFGAALLWLIAGIYTNTYFPDEAKKSTFYSFFLTAMVGNFGLFIAEGLFGFYLFFTLMSIASYGLVVFTKEKEAFHAGLVYMVMVIIGEVLLFIAFLLLAQLSDTTSFETIRTALSRSPDQNLILLLLLISLGIKAGIIGLHVWLPLAHPVAPTPASAVLSGAMINAGLLGWVRTFPMGEVALSSWASILIILGVVAQIYGVVVGITQRNPKTLLAYSSISQMGIITMLVGFGMYLPQHWTSIAASISLFALHHGLNKGALFLGVGMLGDTSRKARYLVWYGLCIPALALAALPYSSGMAAKYMVKSSLAYFDDPWRTTLAIVLFIGTINTTLLMAKLLYLTHPSHTPFGVRTKASLLLPWFLLLGIIVTLPFIITPFSKILLQANPIPFATPLLISILLFVAVVKGKRFGYISPIPAGDILVYYENGIRWLVHTIRNASWIVTRYHRLTKYLSTTTMKFVNHIVLWIK